MAHRSQMSGSDTCCTHLIATFGTDAAYEAVRQKLAKRLAVQLLGFLFFQTVCLFERPVDSLGKT